MLLCSPVTAARASLLQAGSARSLSAEMPEGNGTGFVWDDQVMRYYGWLSTRAAIVMRRSSLRQGQPRVISWVRVHARAQVRVRVRGTVKVMVRFRIRVRVGVSQQW